MSTQHTTPVVTITFDVDSRDYVVELGGQLVGYAPTRRKAEDIASETYHRMLVRQIAAVQAKLDAGTFGA